MPVTVSSARRTLRNAWWPSIRTSWAQRARTFHSFTLAVSEVTERAELPLVTFSYSDLITSRGFNYIFQTSATGDRQAAESLPILLDLVATPERKGRRASAS